MMYGYDDGWGTGGWVLMSLLMLAFSALIILAVIALLRSTRANPPPTPAAGPAGSASALRTLGGRVAHGEIDQQTTPKGGNRRRPDETAHPGSIAKPAGIHLSRSAHDTKPNTGSRPDRSTASATGEPVPGSLTTDTTWLDRRRRRTHPHCKGDHDVASN